jgi:hypothetical protein
VRYQELSVNKLTPSVLALRKKSTSAQMADEGDPFERRLLDLDDQTHGNGNAHELEIDRSRRQQSQPANIQSGDKTQICGDTANKASNVLAVYDGNKSSTRCGHHQKYGLSDPKLPEFRRILVKASASRAHSCRIEVTMQCILGGLASSKA